VLKVGIYEKFAKYFNSNFTKKSHLAATLTPVKREDSVASCTV